MTLPQAILCILGDEPPEHFVEKDLQSIGFALFTVTWKELETQPNGWIQILQPLDDSAVTAWVIVGKAADFTESVRAKIAMLTLALKRKTPPATAFVVTDDEEIGDVPYAMNHIHIYRRTEKYAAKLLVAKVKPEPLSPLHFHVKAHLDPLVGAWLEVGPPDDEKWDGFMIAVTHAEIIGFGIGPRGIIPAKAQLEFPILGIEGTLGDLPFSACAAKNELTPEISCYMRLDGTPGNVLCLDYPDDDSAAIHPGRPPVQLELI